MRRGSYFFFLLLLLLLYSFTALFRKVPF